MVRLLQNFLKNEKQSLILLFFLALLVRAVFVYIEFSAFGTTKFSDDWRYLRAGEQFANGFWLTEIKDPPWIPLMSAVFYSLFGSALLQMIIYNITIGAACVPVLFYLGKRVFNANIGWLLAIWGVFWLESFIHYPRVLKEPSLYFFLPLTLLFLVKCIQEGNKLKYIAIAALAFSLVIHTDERFIIYLPFLVLIFFMTNANGFFKKTKAGLSWVLLVLLLMLPWTIRNYFVYDQLVILAPRTTIFTSKVFGDNLTETLLFDENHRAESTVSRRQESAEAFGKKHGITPHLRGKREAQIKAFIHYWQPTFFNPAYIQYGYRGVQWSFRANMAFLLSYGVFLPFFVLGLFFLVKNKHYTGLFLAAIPLFHSLLHAYMVWPLARYRSPTVFIIAMIGIYAANELVKLIRLRHQKQPPGFGHNRSEQTQKAQ